jgi:hypothetical protein
MIGFRHCDARFPFLWRAADQPPARWHGPGEGPVNYFADTPVGAWAEFLRHEEIRDAQDLAGVRRSLWAVVLPDGDLPSPALDAASLRGDPPTYGPCQAEARRLRAAGAVGLVAPSAALKPGAARGWTADPDERAAPTARDGLVIALFSTPSTLVGWPAAEACAPPVRILECVAHLHPLSRAAHEPGAR